MAEPPTPGASGDPDPVVAGIVGRPHGLDGSFHVAAPARGMLAVGATVTVGGLAREVQRLAGTGERPIVRVSGCGDRDAAQALRGRELLVARAAIGALDADEWWASDLEGCAVCDGEREVGVVEALVGLPSCEALQVRTPAGFEGGAAAHAGLLLVPLVRDAVRDVDVEARRIDVDLAFLGVT
jgi:16S rRNA processing protein RimM